MSSKIQIDTRLKSIHRDEDFYKVAKITQKHQLEKNPVYKRFVSETDRLNSEQFTFLPIELFKNHRVCCETSEELLFKSSGTSSSSRSMHYVFDSILYKNLSKKHFEDLYGPLDALTILALLPSYLENGESSLVYMVEDFIRQAKPQSAFVLNDLNNLNEKLQQLKISKSRTILFGVSYALLDFAETQTTDFPELIIMETGGMKGRRKELTRPELHIAIRKGFPSSEIHSEYGMTELLSQGYSKDGEWFVPPNWMKAFVTDVSDPFEVLTYNRRGLLAFVDLANYHSCSFIQTRDIGIVLPDGRFKVEGRLDHSELRGCNLLYT